MKPLRKHQFIVLWTSFALICLILVIYSYFPQVFIATNFILIQLVFFFFLYKFIKRYWIMYLMIMFGKKLNHFNSKIDKPRIFLNSIFLPFLLLFIVFFYKNQPNNFEFLIMYGKNLPFIMDLLSWVLIIIPFFIASYVLYLSWSKDFEGWFFIEIRKVVKKLYPKDFNIQLNREQLGVVFDGLVNLDYLEVDDDLKKLAETKEKFIYTFFEGKYPSQPIFKLKLDNLHVAYFFDKLNDFSQTGLQRPGCAKIFLSKNGKIKPTALSTEIHEAKKFSKGSFRIKEIDQLFPEKS